jgi:hypothetical protein
MSDDKLKLVETCALLILMGEAREVANSYLTNEIHLELKAPNRNRLVQLGLIEVRKERQRLFLNLTDRGWAHALAAIGTEVPARAGAAGAAVYRLVASLRNYLATSGFAPADFFAPRGEEKAAGAPALPRRSPSAPSVSDVAALIRKAYGNLAAAPRESVELVRIRAALGEISRSQVDAALIDLSSSADVHIFPESNQKTLTADDRAASVSIGNQDKHLIVIDS